VPKNSAGLIAVVTNTRRHISIWWNREDIWQLKIKNWTACVQDRGKWKEVVENAKTFN
jgi:hypothetical protein